MRRLVWMLPVTVALSCKPERPTPESPQAASAVIAAALSSLVPGERAVAFDAVGAAQLTEHLEALRAAAKDPDPFVRAAVLRARIRLEPEAVGEDLRVLAASTVPLEQRRALHAARSGLPAELSATLVEAAARSNDAAVRKESLEFLDSLPVESRRRVVASVLDDADESVRFFGMKAAFRTRLSDPLPRLLDDLMLGPTERRSQAARLLGEVGEASAIPALMHAAGQDKGVLGPTASASLCRLGVIEECARLRSAVSSRDLGEAGPAIAALAATGDALSRELLASAVTHPEPDIRREVAYVLGASGQPDLQRLLLPLLDDERAEPRALAAAALIELEPTRALATVKAAVSGSHPGLRDRLIDILSRQYATYGGEQCAEALGRLAHLRGGHEAEAIYTSELPGVMQALRALLAHGAQLARGLAADAALRHPTAELRFLAAREVATGAVDDPGQALIEALEDPVPAVRITAAAARLRLTRSGTMTP